MLLDFYLLSQLTDLIEFREPLLAFQFSSFLLITTSFLDYDVPLAVGLFLKSWILEGSGLGQKNW